MNLNLQLTPENEESFFEILDGLRAYDAGATDSGIHDNELKQSIANTLASMDTNERNRLLSRFVRRLLTDDAMSEGYDITDVAEILQWLENELDISL